MQFFVDVIVETAPGELLLVERGVSPFGWAFPGGAVDEGECPQAAARREVEEETGLVVRIEDVFHIYPFFDSTGVMSGVTYVFRATVQSGRLKAGDDVTGVTSMPLSMLPHLISAHEEILFDYVNFRRNGCRPEPGRWLSTSKDAEDISYKKAA